MEVIKLFDIPKEIINDNERQRRVCSSDGISPIILGRSDNAKIMEVKVIGQMDNTIDHTFESANRVYDVGGVSPTINTCGGGGLQPKILEYAQAIRMVRTEEGKALRKEYESGAIHHGFNEHREMELRTDGVSNTLSTVLKDNYVCEKSIVAMRGRNPDKPSDRTVGAPTEQRLEPNSQGICNTLTSVQKDNLVMETVKIKQATSQGYIECEVGGVADLSFPDSKTRRGRVQENGQVSPTLMAGETDICRIETYSPYVNKKYKEFQEENGYIPEYFNPYNKTDLRDIAPTLTAQGESITKSGTVLKCDSQYRIRKLTPKECWRLMDFTDEDFRKAEQVNSNTQLYKQAGNSIVRNVLVAILGQMIPCKENIYKQN